MDGTSFSWHWAVSFQRITIEEIRADPWFKKNHVAIRRGEDENVSLDDIQAVFDNIEVCGTVLIG
jgi:hypothetical protein